LKAVSAKSTCPEPNHLAQLLGGMLPEDEHRELTGHLDGCADCQAALERLAVGDTGLPTAIRAVADEELPPSRSKYWHAIEELEQEPTPTLRSGRLAARMTSILLEFLEPTETPGYLGRLAHFEVEKLLGRGGMGMVVRAFDTHLQRHVAIKVLDPQLADDTTARTRFCREARSAASITHENVVTIYHVEKEESSGLPFLVMQVVTGESLQDRLERDGAMSVGDILRIGLQTAVGLAAAHEKGLVHRDIKPANILLEANSDRVKLTDFGLARAAEDVRLTQTGFVTGTPLYMSPEQARGMAVDHRADLYSLGAVLYQMATGDPPFEGDSPLALLRRVEQEEPIPVRDVNSAIPEPLARVIERLLAKDPADRYQSAAEVAELLAHQLAVTHAAPSPTLGLPRVRQRSGPLRRRRTPAERFWMIGALSAWGLLTVVTLGLAATEWTGRTHLVASLLRWNPADDVDDGNSVEARLVLNGNAGPIWSTRFSADGATLAMAIDDGTVKLWDVETGRISGTINAHKSPIWRIAWNPVEKQIATASDDNSAKIWDTTTSKLLLTLKHDAAVRAVAFAPNGRFIATASRKGTVRVWSLATGKEVFEAAGHDGMIYGLTYSPDGNMIASSGSDRVIRLWDAASGRELITLRGHIGGVYAAAFSPDSKAVATGGWDKTIRLWDVASGNTIAMLQGHTQDVWSVAFSPDGTMLVSGGEDHTARVWDVATHSLLQTMRGSTGSIYTVAFAPDGHTFAAAGRDGMVRLWNWP
jgi:eukaryotic-like serine/threonine-protein kinase